MTKLLWDQTGEKTYETGVSHGVLYIPDEDGVYDTGVPWNGLTTVTESPSGAESNKQYADNQVYLNLISAELFSATIEAYTFPDEFLPFDGLGVPVEGLSVGQQPRGVFGLSYQTLFGNDLLGNSYAYKVHMVYGCQAAPSERAYASVNESPEAINFSWEISTTPVSITDFAPTSILTVDSSQFTTEIMTDLTEALYGDSSTGMAHLPTPDEVITLLGG